jgi:hypothetical protein
MTTRDKDPVASALIETLISPNESDSNLEAANVVDGLFAIARALNKVALALRDLGNGDATTSMGAIEAFGNHIGQKLDSLTDVIGRSLGES